MAKTRVIACTLLIHASVAFRPEKAAKFEDDSIPEAALGGAAQRAPGQKLHAASERQVGETSKPTQDGPQSGSGSLVDLSRPRFGPGAIDKSHFAAFAEIGPPQWMARFGEFGHHLFASVTVAVVVKIACMVGNVLVQVSPLPQVQDWQGKGSTGNAEPAPYVAMALGGWQWCTYGLAAWALSKNPGFLVLVYANCLGAALGCYYTFVFNRNCRDSGAARNLRCYLLAALCLVAGQICMWLSLPPARALTLHSCIAGGCSFVNAASLLASLPEVLRSGDTSGICGPLVLANFAGSFLWAYWGFLMNDTVIIAANSFAALSSSVCLYAKFFPRAMDDLDKPRIPDLKCAHADSGS